MKALDAIAHTADIIAADVPKSGLPRIICAADFVANPPPRPPEIIKGLLYKGGKAVYGGPSKAFKTWQLLSCGICVSQGRDWLGFQTAKARVLYINFELQDFGLDDRLKALSAALGVNDLGNLDLWNLRGYSAPLDKIMPDILQRIKTTQYGLIIPDPIYKTLGGRNENDAGEVGEVCNEIERLAVQSGAAVAFGAHFAKGNASSKDAIDRISGSGVWARDPDAVMVATPHQEADAFTVECRLRNHAPLDPFCIRWEFPLMRRDGELDPADLKKSKGGREAEHEPEEIAALLCAAALTTSDWRDAAAKQLGVSESTFYRLRKTAEVRGIARKNSMTHKWELKK